MPFFAANISDGYMFGKKPIQDRIASCRSMELEAIEINNPYNTSPSHLAALLHNDETGESLQLVCIDTYNGPIDAPISQYAENNINDFINQGNTSAAMSDNSETSSIAATTQASLAYLNSDHKLFPREKLDGYASLPGALFAFNNSIATTFTYASVINVPCVNILPGTISNHNPLHATIFNDIMSSIQILYVNDTHQPHHDERCPATCCCSNQLHDSNNTSCQHQSNYSRPTRSDFIQANPCYNILQPSAIEQQQLICCPPYSMVISVTLPLYLTQSLTIPTVLPRILCRIPLPYVQSMSQTINHDPNTPSPNPVSQQPPFSVQPLSTTDPASTCASLSRHYSYLAKTQHLNNKSYFLMKKLLPSSFLNENAHSLFDVFHHSFYLYEVVDLYQHYYNDVYRVLNKESSVSNNTSNQPHSSNSPILAAGNYYEESKESTLFQQLLQYQTQFHKMLQSTKDSTTLPTNPLYNHGPTTSPYTPSHYPLDIAQSSHQRQSAPHKEQAAKEMEKEGRESGNNFKSSETSFKAVKSPFSALAFPIHQAYVPNPTSSTSTFQTSHMINDNNDNNNNNTNNNNAHSTLSQPQLQPANAGPLDITSPRFDYFLTSLIFTTLVFNVKFAARNASRNERLRDHLALTLSLTPHSYLSTVFRLLRVMVFCSNDNIGILFDASSIYTQHGNVIALFERLSPLIRHARVTNSHPELDNTVLFNSMHQLNYTGWVSLDFSMSHTSVPTKKLLQPWFSHYLRRRNGSAGVLFMCRGKQGKVYVLLGKETKHGQKTVGPFWGRPDKTDTDVEMTAVRETIEESLGCVVNNATVLYSALKNKGFYYKCPRINLYLVNIGVLGVKERNDVVARYSWLRHVVLTNSQLSSPEAISALQHQPQSPLSFPLDALSPGGPAALGLGTAGKDKALSKSLMEMNDVVWIDLYDMYRHYIIKSYRILQDYGIVIETSNPTPGSPNPNNDSPKSPCDDDDKEKKKKKKAKDEGKGKKKDKKGKDKNGGVNAATGDEDDNEDGDEGYNGVERETIVLQPPHNSEHTITSLINTIAQQRGNYNNLPLRRFFVREMLYMWLIDPNWINLVHKRDFSIHSIERLMQLHQQYIDGKDKEGKQQPQSPSQHYQPNSRAVQHQQLSSSSGNPDDDISHKQWRSAPL